MDRPREGLVLHLLPHRRRLHLGDTLGRAYERHGDDEPRELVDRVERLLQRRPARDAEVIAMGLYGVHQLALEAGLLEDRAAVLRMSFRVALVVEVVKEADDAPGLDVTVVARREMSHHGFDRERVLAQVLGLRVLAEQSPRGVA